MPASERVDLAAKHARMPPQSSVESVKLRETHQTCGEGAGLETSSHYRSPRHAIRRRTFAVVADAASRIAMISFDSRMKR
jgi:hypothetical protein